MESVGAPESPPVDGGDALAGSGGVPGDSVTCPICLEQALTCPQVSPLAAAEWCLRVCSMRGSWGHTMWGVHSSPDVACPSCERCRESLLTWFCPVSVGSKCMGSDNNNRSGNSISNNLYEQLHRVQTLRFRFKALEEAAFGGASDTQMYIQGCLHPLRPWPLCPCRCRRADTSSASRASCTTCWGRGHSRAYRPWSLQAWPHLWLQEEAGLDSHRSHQVRCQREKVPLQCL